MPVFEPALPLPAVGERTATLRAHVRRFIADELTSGGFEPQCNSWTEGPGGAFSRRLGVRSWNGYHWPAAYGGRGVSAFDTLTINEALLAAGDTYFAIGMSEPDVGSDRASVRTRAEPSGASRRLDGRKVWTSGAHIAHYAIVLCRTAPADPKARHAGLSQFIVDLKAPGVSIRPILMLDGSHHFNEVTFDGVELPAECLVGQAGDGWKQVTSELAYERSGPERILSTMPIVERCLRLVLEAPAAAADAPAGRLLARLI